MSDTLVQRIRAHIRLNERVTDYPYPDNKGKITSGAGFLMDDRDSFMKQPWEIRNGNAARPATQAEKEAAWLKLREAAVEQGNGANKRADNFENATPLRLPKEAIEADLDAKVRQHMDQARKEIGVEAWDRLTDGQKTAIADVHYARGGLDSFGKLKEHAKSGNSVEMAREIGVKSGSDSNNNPIRNWDRERRNHAAILGIDPDSSEAWKVTAEKYQGEKNLPVAYRQHLPTPQPTEPPKESEPAPQKQSDLGADGQAFLERIRRPNERPALDIAAKNPEHWTKDEADMVIQDYQRFRHPDPLNAWLREQTSDHFKSRYGEKVMRQGLDGQLHATGPGILYATPNKTAATPDPHAIQKTLEQFGGKLAPAFDFDGLSGATKSMQQGLNILNGGKMPRLKEDGDWGPITDFSFKKSVARHGAAKVDEGFALGRLQSLAEKPQQPEDLAKQTQKIFGPLYGSQEKGDDHALALQAGLNAVGSKYQDNWQPLKLDGDIGPKTTDAFNQISSAAGPQALAQDIGGWLGWLE